jgi:type II secretory pathway pseudopilin PulG
MDMRTSGIRQSQHLADEWPISDAGFSFVELLLVVGIVGLILWVLIPIGLRTRVDAQYGVVRQNCSVLASYASQWVHHAIQAQDEQRSTATIADYYSSLAGISHAPELGSTPGEWVASNIGPTNWRHLSQEKNLRYTRKIEGRFMNGKRSTEPETTVEDIIPPENPILNPFTQKSIFNSANFPVEKTVAKTEEETWAIPGAIAFGGFRENEGGWVNFAFVFQGEQNTGIELDGQNTFLSGMNLQTIQGLRAGVFVARIR